MNSKMTTNSQLLTTEPNKKQKQTKQTARTGTESKKWRVIRWWGEGENGGKGTGIKKQNWQVQNQQGDIKSSKRNGEAKELLCVTHGHELRQGNAGGNGGTK